MRRGAALLALALAGAARGQAEWRTDSAGLPPVPPPAAGDWLVDPAPRAGGIFAGDTPAELVLDNGLIRRSFRLAPDAACVGLDVLTTGSAVLRAVRPEARVTLCGHEYAVGGLLGQPLANALRAADLDALAADPHAFHCIGWRSGPIEPRCAWTPHREWLSRAPVWPPPGVELVLHFVAPPDAPTRVEIDVHHEIYAGLPLLGKWLVVRNTGAQPVRVDDFVPEILACVEPGGSVEDEARPSVPDLHVETDATVVGSTAEGASRHTVRWLPDPDYPTQVSWLRQSLCLLECHPPSGPGLMLAPGDTLESFHVWLLPGEGGDAVRRRLALSRLSRTLAPWCQENPLIFHAGSAAPDAVRGSLAQAADVGFELVLLTFGSGLDMEDVSPGNLATYRALADEAHARGLALGGYSLLASRSIGPDDDVVNPATGKPGGFATFGNSPCLLSAWGLEYFRKLRTFLDQTGFDALEHDGSYPGDVCASTQHPGHAGLADSYWLQRAEIVGFYRELRGRGTYLNVPDWYFLNGSSKTGMGYRESNWSLPREQQLLIERQNIQDGLLSKGPTMGWMFVPLSEYQGGGQAATIEPLDAHLDHYEQRLEDLLGAGVQACWRGPRLYDTPRTRDLVAHWVGWFKSHRRILESDVVPLRRPDGRDWDGLLHVDPDPAAPERALAALYNPLDAPLARTLRLPLRYAGLSGAARVVWPDGHARRVPLDADRVAEVEVQIPARGFLPLVVEAQR